MTYMGKNINMTLIILMVGVVVALLGITVFFQLGLSDRTSAFEMTSENLTACEVQVVNYQERLSQAQTQIDSTAQDIRRYDQLYETKVAELSDTEGELTSANTKISNLNLIKTGLEQEVSNLKSERSTLQGQVSSLQVDVSVAQDDADRWKDKYYCCRGRSTIDECLADC